MTSINYSNGAFDNGPEPREVQFAKGQHRPVDGVARHRLLPRDPKIEVRSGRVSFDGMQVDRGPVEPGRYYIVKPSPFPKPWGSPLFERPPFVICADPMRLMRQMRRKLARGDKRAGRGRRTSRRIPITVTP